MQPTVSRHRDEYDAALGVPFSARGPPAARRVERVEQAAAVGGSNGPRLGGSGSWRERAASQGLHRRRVTGARRRATCRSGRAAWIAPRRHVTSALGVGSLSSSQSSVDSDRRRRRPLVVPAARGHGPPSSASRRSGRPSTPTGGCWCVGAVSGVAPGGIAVGPRRRLPASGRASTRTASWSASRRSRRTSTRPPSSSASPRSRRASTPTGGCWCGGSRQRRRARGIAAVRDGAFRPPVDVVGLRGGPMGDRHRRVGRAP